MGGYSKDNHEDFNTRVPRCTFCKSPGHKFYHCWEYRDYQSRKCFECGLVGHIRKHCPKKNYSCVRCGKGGHYARDCQELPPKGKKGPQRQVKFGRNEVFEVEKIEWKAIWKTVLEDQMAIKAATKKGKKNCSSV